MKLEKGLCLELNSIKDNDKIKISPVGEQVLGYDGRVFKIDANFIVSNTKAQGIDILLDKDHRDSEAMGWFDINSLEARDDGIYAKLDYTDVGKELVDKRLFRYLSPAYEVNYRDNGVREVVRIASVGLVNRPNLLNKSLNKEEIKVANEDKNKEIQLSKQLSDSLSENSRLKGEIEVLKAENENLKTALKTEQNNSKVERIESAIKNGEMLPSRKETALGLEANALNSYLEVCKSEAASVLKEKNIEKNSKSETENIDPSVKAQLGL